MKIPKTFLLNKNLERKTNELLKKRLTKKRENFVDKEAEKLFSNFIKFLKEEYGVLYIKKLDEEKQAWTISTQNRFNRVGEIGSITSYVESEGISSMYGYKAEVIVQGKLLNLIYRVGHHYYDINGKAVSTVSPARYDIEEVPFP